LKLPDFIFEVKQAMNKMAAKPGTSHLRPSTVASANTVFIRLWVDVKAFIHNSLFCFIVPDVFQLPQLNNLNG